jgi:hypothetical protein
MKQEEVMRKLINQEFLIISGGAICARRKLTGENVNEIFNEVFAGRYEVVDRIKDKNHWNDDCLRFVK